MTRRIVVLNPKGGSGKTTIATNLAAQYAAAGYRIVLTDYDPQGSSTRWLKTRPAELPPIHGIQAYDKNAGVTRSFLLRLPEGTERVVMDTPAGLRPQEMQELVREADAILVPVMPSDIDIHACSKCIADLLLVAKVRRREQRIGVIANRTRRNTRALETLLRFLATLEIPLVATLRDSQNYVRSAAHGNGIHEMKTYLVREDLEGWRPLLGWLDARFGDIATGDAVKLKSPKGPELEAAG
jgi:chromosome partitioning protein